MCYCQRGSETCREQYSSAGTLPTRVTPHVNWATIGAISQSAIGRKRRHRWSNKRKTGAYASRFNVPVWLNEFPLFPTFFEGFQLFAEGTLPGLWEDLHCWLHEQMWLVSWGGETKKSNWNPTAAKSKVHMDKSLQKLLFAKLFESGHMDHHRHLLCMY